MPDRVAAIWPKVQRAEQHIEELKRVVRNFHESRPCKGISQDDPKTGQVIYEVTDIRDIPVDVPLLIGDALQILRSALDYLARELVLAAGATPSTNTFPISKGATEYAAESPRKVEGMGQKVVDKIAG